jgi:hypothetical protein
MSINKWVVRIADGQFCLGDGPDPAAYLSDQAAYTVVDLGDDVPIPDPRIVKWNGSVVVPKTAQEIAAFDAARLTAKHSATSRQKDVLATCALIVRARGIAAWNAMTTQQKVTATLAEADVWAGIRDFIEDKV